METSQDFIQSNQNIFERIIDSIDEAIFSNDLEGNVLSWNKAAEKIFGYSFEEIKKSGILAIFPQPLREEEAHFIATVKQGLNIDHFETKRVRKDGAIIDVAITVWPLRDQNNQIIGLSKMVQEITERKLADLKIAESEEKYKNLFKNSPLPMWVLEIPSLKFLGINQTSIAKYGFSREEFLTMTVYDMMPKKDHLKSNNIDRSIYNYQLPTKNWIHLKKNGEEVYVEVTSLEITYEGKRARLVISIDITERLRSEAKIKKLDHDFINTQRRYRSIIDYSIVAIFLASPNGKLLEANQAANDMFGYTNDEFKKIHRNDLIDMSTPNAQKLLLERTKKGSIRGEFVGIKKNGSRFYCEITSVIFKDHNGKTFSSNMISDISERKASEEAVKKTNSLLMQAEVLANIGSIQIDFHAKESQWSNGFYSLLGYEPQSFKPNKELFYAHFSKSEAERHKSWLREAIQQKVDKKDFDAKIIRTDQKIRILSSTTYFYYNEKGELSKLIALIQDVTEAKESQIALEQSQEIVYKERALLRSIIDSPKDIFIISMNKEYRLTAFTKGFIDRMLVLNGKTPKIGMSIFDLVDADAKPRLKKLYDRALRAEYFMHEHSIESLNGEKQYYENHYNPIHGVNGEILGITIFIHDVSQVKKMEIMNKLNSQRYSALFSGASDAIFIADIATKKLVDVNNYGLTLLGYKKEELIGQNISFIHPKEELAAVQEIFKKFTNQIKEGHQLGEESYALHKSGKKIPILISAGSIFTIDDRTYSAAYFKDLTDVKTAESKVENMVNLLKRAESIAHIGSIEIDLISGKRIWSDEFYRILGYAPNSIEPNQDDFLEQMFGIEKTNFINWYQRSLHTFGLIDPIEINIINKIGEPKTLLISGITNANEAGELVKHIGVVMDITLRRELESNLELSHKRLVNLSDKIPLALMQLDFAGEDKYEMSFVSNGIKTIYKGLKIENLQQNPNLIMDWVVDEDKERVQEAYQSSLEKQIDLNIECRIRNLKKELSWIKIFYRPEKSKNGHLTWYGYIEDITLQKELLLNLEYQNQQLKEIAWTQSHLVRAPLSKLMGFVNLLIKGNVSSEKKQVFLEYIQVSAQELDKIIKDITSLTIMKK